ncbi:MAG TPA: CoB--CoM heterodisulfide reductase subunit B [Methanosarcinales archaeon]|nr:CoB--CoM heterodisulfide reductase subunit B [Methanosarcinales archaeon]
MTKISLYLGCLVPNRYPEIEVATKSVLDKLEVDFEELKGASCCPAPGLFRSFSSETWLALAARNIVLSEEKNLDLLTICNGCYASLSDANNILNKNFFLKVQINKHLQNINKEFKGNINVRHIIEFLYKDIGVKKIYNRISNPLDLKVAVHYGCHLLRPRKERNLGSPDNPTFFDELVEATGCKSIEYEDKMACCGAGGGVRSFSKETALKMTDHKLECIKKAGVDCIVDACPFCLMQFDIGQKEILSLWKKDYNIPVLHYTQLLDLTL